LIIIVSSNPPPDAKPQRDVVNDHLKNLRPPIFIQNKADKDEDRLDQRDAGCLIIAPPAIRRYCMFKKQDREAALRASKKKMVKASSKNLVAMM